MVLIEAGFFLFLYRESPIEGRFRCVEALMNLMRHGCASDANAYPSLRALYTQFYPRAL